MLGFNPKLKPSLTSFKLNKGISWGSLSYIPFIDSKDVVIRTQNDDIVLFEGKIYDGTIKGKVDKKSSRHENN